MKKSLSLLVMAFLVLSAMPLIMADGDDVIIGGGVIVGEECYASTISVDHTARGWFPNDQTIKTADVYGDIDSEGKYDCGSDYDRYNLDERMNYVFTGETVDYYVLVRDLNGVSDIDKVEILVGAESAGACAPVDQADCAVNFSTTAFGVSSIDTATDQVYICKLIVAAKYTTELDVSIKVTDGRTSDCTPSSNSTTETDRLFFNPSLTLTATGGPVSFGSVSPGTVATSNSIYLKNEGASGSGVVMDVYIASDDYFTDSTNPGTAICPTGNGIKYDRFSYYATKGSLNSGANDNSEPALGASGTDICVARGDEFTVLPSNSGHIEDMCRIINHRRAASLLTQGSEMSITFRLDVPSPCKGNFNNGRFHFVGRVV